MHFQKFYIAQPNGAKTSKYLLLLFENWTMHACVSKIRVDTDRISLKKKKIKMAAACVLPFLLSICFYISYFLPWFLEG